MKFKFTLFDKIILPGMAVLFFLTIYFYSYPLVFKTHIYSNYLNYKENSFKYFNKKNYNIYESKNIILYYSDKSNMYIKDISSCAEKNLYILQESFNYTQINKVNIIVCSSVEEMNRHIEGVGCNVMGIYSKGIIYILDPSLWIEENYSEYTLNKEGPILHELTHYIIDKLTGGNINVYLTEGLALYEEYFVNDVIWIDDIKYNSFYTPSSLKNSFYILNENKAYKQSFVIVKYIIDNYSINILSSMLGELKKGKALEDVITKYLKINESKLFYEACKNIM